MDIPHAMQKHVADALKQLIGESGCASARFGVAVSGGPDSMALLHVLHAIAPGRVLAATMDHQLRAEAAYEAAMVAATCANWGIAHQILLPGTPITGSLQAAARAARYAMIDLWRIEQQLDWVLTAHHADDQLETLLMRLQRGSGLAGLAGVRARNGHILRPMLGVRRTDIILYCHKHGLVTIDDPSNADPAYDRVRLRAALTDAASRPIAAWLEPLAASATAQHLADDAVALDWAAAQYAEQAIAQQGDGRVRLNPVDCPPALWRRVMLHALHRVDPGCQPRGAALDDAMSAMADGQVHMLGNVVIRSHPGYWLLAPAPPRKAG